MERSGFGLRSGDLRQKENPSGGKITDRAEQQTQTRKSTALLAENNAVVWQNKGSFSFLPEHGQILTPCIPKQKQGNRGSCDTVWGRNENLYLNSPSAPFPCVCWTGRHHVTSHAETGANWWTGTCQFPHLTTEQTYKTREPPKLDPP